MKTTLRLLLTSALMAGSLSPQLAVASYEDDIAARTARYEGISGKWFSLTQADWVFYDSEAATSNNMGAIKAGEKVEVLKMNRFMARVRLPDGRVVFVRNRLLKASSAPTATEKSERAAQTAKIGKLSLARKDASSRPTAQDLGGEIVSADALTTGSVPVSKIPIPTPAVRSETVLAAPVLTTTEKPVEKPVPVIVQNPAVKPVVTATTPLPFVAEPAQKTETYVNPFDILLGKKPAADEAALPSDAAAYAAIPAERPVDPATLVTLYDGGKCDPNAKWQSPIREAYRVRDCVGSSRGHSRNHAGIDIAGAKPGMRNIPIFPVSSGKVIRSGFNRGYGCLVIVQHDSCPAETTGRYAKNGKCTTRYAHMATKTVKDSRGKKTTVCDVPKEGTRVSACTQIGKMSGTGSSGRANDYPSHLHFEMRDSSESVVFNPINTLAVLRTSPDYRAASKSCGGVSSVIATSAKSLNRGGLSVLIRTSEGID